MLILTYLFQTLAEYFTNITALILKTILEEGSIIIYI